MFIKCIKLQNVTQLPTTPSSSQFPIIVIPTPNLSNSIPLPNLLKPETSYSLRIQWLILSSSILILTYSPRYASPLILGSYIDLTDLVSTPCNNPTYNFNALIIYLPVSVLHYNLTLLRYIKPSIKTNRDNSSFHSDLHMLLQKYFYTQIIRLFSTLTYHPQSAPKLYYPYITLHSNLLTPIIQIVNSPSPTTLIKP